MQINLFIREFVYARGLAYLERSGGGGGGGVRSHFTKIVSVLTDEDHYIL